MTLDASQPGGDEPSVDVHPEDTRRCVACGYSLFGLGDEPRCPECGLLNIPEAYRRQVWELVDSGKWFFSGFFSPFRKRLPGWWWALDRPGDVRRAIRFAVYCILAVSALITTSIFVADSIRIEEIHIETYTHPEYNAGAPKDLWRHTSLYGAGGTESSSGWTDTAAWHDLPPGGVYASATSFRIVWRPYQMPAWVTVLPALWAVLLWAMVALVGLWTQIRKGLPGFARAPRTIIAASCYEAHRLVHLGAFAGLLLLLDAAVRCAIATGSTASVLHLHVGSCGSLLVLAGVTFGVAGWVGPLRSDYTRQLVRSRFHAVRMIVMYAVLLPPLMIMAASALIGGYLRWGW